MLPETLQATPESAPAWSVRQGIRASAGSGKTYSLTGQFLRAFLNGAQPSGMLATTFTRKAAGEILGRVLQRMANSCENQEELDRLCRELQLSPMECATSREELLRLCQSLHQVSISTIDGFFAKLLSGYNHELGVASGMRMLDGESPDIQRIRQEAFARSLSRRMKRSW